ncbi:MAG: transglutaminase domain-containing protein [Gammaproteobacteria bacterium]
MDKKTTATFDKNLAHIRAHNLPAVIQKRLTRTVTDYRNKMDNLMQQIDQVSQIQDVDEQRAQLAKLKKYIDSAQQQRSQQPFDPNKLPFRSETGKDTPKPRLTTGQFAAAGLYNSPKVQVAALGDFTFSNLAGADNPAYLGESVEVQITQAIKDQAAVLNHDPIQIYHWVRNNVEWLPTWGSMQDAETTLGSRRGNAFDIASLLIALLRASGIPARYAHGTIDLDAERFKNWMGGFTSIDAAADFAASGGIPTDAYISGGVIGHVKIEHIWVEAAIDYLPSRGQVNRDADSWVAMDASYKQYEYLTGIDVAAVTGLDGQALADSFVASGTVNETEGWVAGLDPTILQKAQTSTQTTLENYITTNLPNATVGDVIGGKKILQVSTPGLPSSLPYTTAIIGARYDKVPGQLQNQATYVLGLDVLRQPAGSVTLPWAQLNNHKLTLSYTPSTPDDEAVLQSFIPSGEITDISQLPGSLPAYLINVTPQIKLDGQLVGEGQPMGLGTEMTLRVTIQRPGKPGNSAESIVPAGAYVALVSVGGSVSSERLTNLQTQLTTTRTPLESGDPAQLASINREDILGDMFYAGVMGYFAHYLSIGRVASLLYGAKQNLLPSVGIYGHLPKVNYFFSIPTAVETGAVEMDLFNISTTTVAQDADKQKRFNFMIATGTLLSTLEHAAPEQMFTSASNPGEAISAVKALSIASAAGQQIYQLTKQNWATVLPNINLSSEVIGEITAALNAGKNVITHTDNISIPNWVGAGYIIYDPEDGDGAYKISGGKNGSFFKWLNDNSDAIGLVTLVLSVFGGPIALIGLFIALLVVQANIMYMKDSFKEDSKCLEPAQKLYGGLAIGSTIVSRLFKVKAAGPAVAVTLMNFITKGAVKNTMQQYPLC